MYPAGTEAPLRGVLIERLLEREPRKRAIAAATFPRRHAIVADRFPGHPVVPGVLLTDDHRRVALVVV